MSSSLYRMKRWVYIYGDLIGSQGWHWRYVAIDRNLCEKEGPLSGKAVIAMELNNNLWVCYINVSKSMFMGSLHGIKRDIFWGAVFIWAQRQHTKLWTIVICSVSIFFKTVKDLYFYLWHAVILNTCCFTTCILSSN